jgi:hypothetical protein
VSIISDINISSEDSQALGTYIAEVSLGVVRTKAERRSVRLQRGWLTYILQYFTFHTILEFIELRHTAAGFIVVEVFMQPSSPNRL